MTANTKQNHYDAVIVGARCAGAATAMLLARQGAKVLVIDHDKPGTDTMSTHALMRGAAMQLGKWGILDRIRAEGTPAIRRTSFIYGDETVDVDIRPMHGTDALYAPRRTVLDAALVEAAADGGVSFRYGTGFAGFLHGIDGRVAGLRTRRSTDRIEEIGADIVIGADGRRSAVARRAGAEVVKQSRFASSVAYRYFEGIPNRGYRWYFRPGASGGIIPTNDGQSCVFVAVPQSAFGEKLRGKGAEGMDAVMREHLPEMAADLAGARPTGEVVAFAGERGFLRQSHGPGWALVGDAGYFKDPITAHGITDAFRDAEILSDAILAGRPESYPALRDGLSAGFFEITDQVASFAWTMDGVKGLHVALNREMKAIQNWIADGMDGQRAAA
ncbi:NAD(P)/FAD-dependent oxidoreductase [Ostreiculturibacter nitratireducens]|uniref:NAD(P)/FAD-dependent oxidoreductase n=1 Tax=Ostreiculturibacter nitratireducens TaxID=3075226 RepID=UPI0031B6469B